MVAVSPTPRFLRTSFSDTSFGRRASLPPRAVRGHRLMANALIAQQPPPPAPPSLVQYPKPTGLETRNITYRGHDGLELQGYVAWDPKRVAGGRKLPGVLVAHTAVGPQEEFISDRVHAVAWLGYVGFGLDLYGAGHLVTGTEQAAFMKYLRDDRTVMQRRMLSALEAMTGGMVAEVDGTRSAAIGYCLGGQAVLDLARTGADVQAVVSFHGILDRPSLPGMTPMSRGCRILACHGASDPFVPLEKKAAFLAEMAERGCDWQLNEYGGVYHGFTRPDKRGPEDLARGFQYDAGANRRSWAACKGLLEEALAPRLPRMYEG